MSNIRAQLTRLELVLDRAAYRDKMVHALRAWGVEGPLLVAQVKDLEDTMRESRDLINQITADYLKLEGQVAILREALRAYNGVYCRSASGEPVTPDDWEKCYQAAIRLSEEGR